MKKILMIMIAVLFVITGCALSESDYNKEMENALKEMDKLIQEHVQNPGLNQSYKYYDGISVVNSDVSKLDLKGANLEHINKYFEEKSKAYKEYGSIYKKYDKEYKSASFEELTDEQANKIVTDLADASQKYSKNIEKYKKAATKSLEKQYKDKDISKKSYELIKQVMESTY